MTARQIDRATRGGSDVVRLPNPKPTAKASWKKSLKSARSYADSWCREWVKLKYSRCVTCNGNYNLQWAHVLSGKGDSVRWEVNNITRQCEKCNNLHEYEPDHLMKWFVETYGQSELFDLTVKSNTVPKYTFSQIMKIGDSYRERVMSK